MADAVTITGLTEVEKVFFNLPNSMAKKAYGPALKAGGNVIKKLASAKIKAMVSSEATGTLARGIAVYSLRKTEGNYRAAVMVRRGLVNKLKIINGQPVRVGLYGSVLEYRDGGKYSWLRPAAREGKDAAFSAVVSSMEKGMLLALQAAKQS